MTTVKVSEKFSRYLGGRYRNDGPWSGEEFRERVLIPELRDAIRDHETLVIDLDGVAGVPSSFLEEAFGGLMRHSPWRLAVIRNTMRLSANNPDLWPYLKLADTFMQEAEKRRA